MLPNLKHVTVTPERISDQQCVSDDDREERVGADTHSMMLGRRTLKELCIKLKDKVRRKGVVEGGGWMRVTGGEVLCVRVGSVCGGRGRKRRWCRRDETGENRGRRKEEKGACTRCGLRRVGA